MTDNQAMLLRYAFTIIVTLVVSKEWIPGEIANPTIELLVGLTVALIPAVYAWFRIENTPKEKKR